MSVNRSVQSSIEVRLFTDGACSGNPGPGGWAYILQHGQSGKEKRNSGSELETTNNRMELLAAIKGLEALHRSTYVELVTDSAYVAKGITEWMQKWKSNGWQRREGKKMKPVKNEDLWRQLDVLCSEHKVRCVQVRGHTGHPENEACDRMAVEAYQQMVRGDVQQNPNQEIQEKAVETDSA